MKKLFLVLAGVVLLALAVMTATKPDRSEHYDTLKHTLLRVIDHKLSSNPLMAGFVVIGTSTALETMDKYLKENLVVHDHLFYNTGVIIFNGHAYPITVGAFGQVWLTVDEDEVKDFVQQTDLFDVNGMEQLFKKFQNK